MDITDVVPKTYYNQSQDSYFLSVTTCVKLLVNTTATNLALSVVVTVKDPHIFIDKVCELQL